MIKVFGHQNPDTDSVVSPIVYAWFLNEHLSQPAEAFVLSAPNKEALYVLERFGQPMPQTLSLVAGDEVAIVDTNNPAELPENIGEAVIRTIVDHHKLVGGLSTAEPLTVAMRPVACTATVLWGVMKQYGVTEVPKHIAGLMTAAILSDTLKLTSPTTTDEDKDVVEVLAQMGGVNAEELASAMFAAKSDLTGMNPKDILLSDSKVFQMGSKKVRISSLETTNPEKALAIEGDLLNAIQDLKKEESLDALFFFVVDIFATESTLLMASDIEKETATKAFEVDVSGNSVLLPGVVSRKKQMVPPLEKVLVG